MMDKPSSKNSVLILVADDDEDDRIMIKEAFDEVGLSNKIDFVEDGQELIDYLFRQGAYEDLKGPLPGLILLDLNMPKKDGRQALREIKIDRQLKLIPIIILTTSKAEEDVLRAYDFGVNSFIVKPSAFEGLVEIVTSLSKYWLDTIILPPDVNSYHH